MRGSTPTRAFVRRSGTTSSSTCAERSCTIATLRQRMSNRVRMRSVCARSCDEFVSDLRRFSSQCQHALTKRACVHRHAAHQNGVASACLCPRSCHPQWSSPCLVGDTACSPACNLHWLGCRPNVFPIPAAQSGQLACGTSSIVRSSMHLRASPGPDHCTKSPHTLGYPLPQPAPGVNTFLSGVSPGMHRGGQLLARCSG